jgi:17beta-estradiol 17-dehydrogenase / very-long-chain 3-oxoacyl-CoA reductase
MSFIYWIGVVATIYMMFNLGKFVYTHFFLKTDLSKYGAKKGAWAVITGAREGVGKGYATALASRGFNVVLIARNKAGLEEVSKELADKYKVETKVVAVDCSNETAVKSIVDEVKNLDVSVLVNNVGVNTTYPTALVETTPEEINSMINVNITFTTHFTQAMIPVLSKRKSLVINLSSFTGRIPVGMMSVYSASKAYIDAFSRALSAELKPVGIDVVSVLPHYVVSAMSGFKRANWMVPEGSSFGKATLDQLSAGDYSISPHWFHDLSTAAIALLPDALVGPQGLAKMKMVRGKLMAKAAKAKTN